MIINESKEDMRIIIAAARRALSDADLFDELVEDLGISDTDMLSLRKRLPDIKLDEQNKMFNWDDSECKKDHFEINVENEPGGADSCGQIYISVMDPKSNGGYGLGLMIEMADGVPSAHITNTPNGDNVLHARATKDGVIIQNDCAMTTPIVESSDYIDGVVYESPTLDIDTPGM